MLFSIFGCWSSFSNCLCVMLLVNLVNVESIFMRNQKTGNGWGTVWLSRSVTLGHCRLVATFPSSSSFRPPTTTSMMTIIMDDDDQRKRRRWQRRQKLQQRRWRRLRRCWHWRLQGRLTTTTTVMIQRHGHDIVVVVVVRWRRRKLRRRQCSGH